MEYNKEYFINKISAIPEEKIGEVTLHEHCILWHLGVRYKIDAFGEQTGQYAMTEEAFALIRLFQKAPFWPNEHRLVFSSNPEHPRPVYAINDIRDWVDKPTPKQRLLYVLSILN